MKSYINTRASRYYSPTDQKIMVQNCPLEPVVSMPHTKLMVVDRGGIYKYIDVYMYMFIYVHIYMCVHIYTHVYMCTHIHVYVCVCVYLYIHVCIYMYF